MPPMTDSRPRAQDLGMRIGSGTPGPVNAITDVAGVLVGHVSLIEGDGELRVGQGPVRTGVTAVLPHGGNLFAQRVRAASFVLNGFGKSVGLPQLQELGCIETPILLTGTLNVWRVADALVDYKAGRNPGVYSFNPIVCECNDSGLNDGLGRHVTAAHVMEAIASATDGPVAEGNVGAGVGMSGFGWKAGIGTASRVVDLDGEGFTVGALVLTNTGEPSELRIGGVQVGLELRPDADAKPAARSAGFPAREPSPDDAAASTDDGSIIILVATDAALSHRQLERIAKRAALGLGRTGATASHGSGDFIIAFSTTGRVSADGRELIDDSRRVREPQLSSLFSATAESVEEAIINSLLRAETLTGRDGRTRYEIPIPGLLEVLQGRR